MSAFVYDVVIDQDADFSLSVSLIDDASGDPLAANAVTSANAELRKHWDSANAVPFVMSVTDGSLIMSMNATTTTGLEAGRYVYDAKLSMANGSVVRILQGLVTVSPAVTK